MIDRLLLAKVFDCQQQAVRCVDYNIDGRYCVTCGADKSIKLWKPERALLLQSYIGHGSEVLGVSSSCDNAFMASCGADKHVVYWDVAAGKPVRKYRGHAGTVNDVQFNEDASVIVSCSLDGTVKAWDARSRAVDPIQTMDEACDSVTCVAVSDHEIVSGSADNRVRLYDLRAGCLLEDFLGSSVTSVQLTRDGACILVSTLDSTLRLIDKTNGELLSKYRGHVNNEYKIDSCLSFCDSKVFSGSENGSIYTWDLVDNEKIIQTLQIPQQSKSVVHSLSPHPKQAKLLAACLGKVYYYNTGEES